MQKLQRVPKPVCLYCGAPAHGELEDPHACRHCKNKRHSYTFARSALLQDAQTTELIHRFKYSRCNYLAPAFAALMGECWDHTPQLQRHDDWVLVPVPISREHLHSRGYNQAAELAFCLGKLKGLSVREDLLQRVNTGISSQTRLSAQKRQRHAEAAFSAAVDATRHPVSAHVLLVDDVYTTGSTTRACSRALRTLPGVKVVGVLTLLRVPFR